MTRRRNILTAGTAALLLLFPLSGCDSSAPTDSGPSGSPNGRIMVASGLDVTGGGIRQRLIKDWNERNPTMQAQLVELPGNADAQRSQLLAALQSGSADYDVVNLDITWIPEFAHNGLIQRLDDDGLLDDDFVPTVGRTASWAGHVYSVPFNSDAGLLYYRTDLLQDTRALGKPGDDWEWGQLAYTMETLKSSSREGAAQGWTTQLSEYEGLTVNTIESFAGSGVTVTDETGHYATSREDLERGLFDLKEHAKQTFDPDRAFESDEADNLEDFAAGRVAFLRHWPYAYGVLTRNMMKGAEFTVTRLPGKAVLGGQNLAVAENSEWSRAADSPAKKLIAFLTGPASQRCLLDAGFAAVRTSVYEQDLECPLEEPAGQSRPKKEAGSEKPDGLPTDGKGRPVYTETLHASLESAVSRPRTAYYGAVTRVLQSLVYEYLNPRGGKQQSPGTVAKKLDEALREALKGH